MPLEVTALYGSLLALVGLALGALVATEKRRHKVSLGDGGHQSIVEANRRHMNWLENVPLLITLLAIIELNGASRTWLHVLGATLLVARLIHPFGVNAEWVFRVPRFVGAFATTVVTFAAVGTLLWQYFA
jgi:uncharacterized membrane protein YecN with MAPEG domain